LEKIIPIFFIVVVTLAVYLRVIGHEFIAYDDPVNVYENPYVLRGTPADFLHFWKAPYEKLYIPVTYTFWGLLAKAAQWFPSDAKGRINPGIFHAANLLIHLLNSLGVQFILARLLKDRRVALVGALLFALHPIHVGPVAWISGFRGVLSAFWGLLALHQYILYCESDFPARRRDFHYLLATGFFILALLSKPTAMVVTAIAGLAGYLILNRPLSRVVRELTPWCFLALAALLIARYAQPPDPYAFKPLFWQRFLIAGDALSFYLYKFLLPLKLGPDYGRSPRFVSEQGWIWVTGIAPYLLATLLVWKGRRPWIFAAGVFLAGLVPTLGFISFDFQRISTVADRFLYLAMLGPAYAIALLFQRYRLKPVRLLLLVWLVLLGVKSVTQVAYWENGFILYKEALRVNPRSWLAYNNLGLKYLRNGQPENAVELFRKAIEIRPLNAKAYNNLAKTMEELGQPEEAINLYRKAMELAPNSHLITLNLGMACRDTGDYQEALLAFQKTVALAPDFAEAHNDLGVLYCLTGKPTEAIASFETAIEIKPDDASAYSNLGKLKTEMGHPAEAIVLFNKALSINEKFVEAAFNLGAAYESIGDEELATRAYKRALEIRPDYGQPWLSLGNLHRKASRPQQAIEAFNQAIDVNPELVDSYLELADLYLELGQRKEAELALGRMPEIDPDLVHLAQRLAEIRQHLGNLPQTERPADLDTAQELPSR
jgi:tetratricopeptide (TPR) repeat protein